MTEGARVEGVIELSIRELRSLTSWSCDCAERSQAIFRRARPEDERVALALAAARDFARGGPRNNHLRKLAMAAFRARAEIKGPAASAAAEAASHAAASAFLHPINKAHQVLHILGAAACASWALAESGEVGLADALNAAFTEAPLEIIALRRRYPALVAPRTRLRESYEKLDALFLAAPGSTDPQASP